jgi:hypothetical protein
MERKGEYKGRTTLTEKPTVVKVNHGIPAVPHSLSPSKNAPLEKTIADKRHEAECRANERFTEETKARSSSAQKAKKELAEE